MSITDSASLADDDWIYDCEHCVSFAWPEGGEGEGGMVHIAWAESFDFATFDLAETAVAVMAGWR